MDNYTNKGRHEVARMRESRYGKYSAEQCELIRSYYRQFSEANTQHGTSVVMFYAVVIANHQREDIREIPLWDAIGIILPR